MSRKRISEERNDGKLSRSVLESSGSRKGVTDFNPSVRPFKSAHTAVRRACDFLHAHYASDVSLEQLAMIAGLSRFA